MLVMGCGSAVRHPCGVDVVRKTLTHACYDTWPAGAVKDSQLDEISLVDYLLYWWNKNGRTDYVHVSPRAPV